MLLAGQLAGKGGVMHARPLHLQPSFHLNRVTEQAEHGQKHPADARPAVSSTNIQTFFHLTQEATCQHKQFHDNIEASGQNKRTLLMPMSLNKTSQGATDACLPQPLERERQAQKETDRPKIKTDSIRQAATVHHLPQEADDSFIAGLL